MVPDYPKCPCCNKSIFSENPYLSPGSCKASFRWTDNGPLPAKKVVRPARPVDMYPRKGKTDRHRGKQVF